jgi:hypothetical protein
MTTTRSSTASGPFGVVAVVAMGLGVLVATYGLLLVPESLLGGGHVAAIGVTLLLAGLFSTEWARNRWNLSESAQRRLVWGFLVLSALLLVTFVVLNAVSFEGPFVESGSESGN